MFDGAVLEGVGDGVDDGEVDGVVRVGALGVALVVGGVWDGVGLVEGVGVGVALGVGVGDGEALWEGGDSLG